MPRMYIKFPAKHREMLKRLCMHYNVEIEEFRVASDGSTKAYIKSGQSAWVSHAKNDLEMHTGDKASILFE